jgi:DNA-binding NtrC family response regulator
MTERTSSETGTEDRRSILIVEDERLMLRLLERVFSERGYHVLTASDGEQAMEIYRRHKLEIDIVLLDIGLPKITGWQVFLKMKEENAGVRVVIASGYLQPELKSEMSRSGIRHFVAKPYMIDDVVGILQNAMQENQGTADEDSH